MAVAQASLPFTICKCAEGLSCIPVLTFLTVCRSEWHGSDSSSPNLDLPGACIGGVGVVIKAGNDIPVQM